LWYAVTYPNSAIGIVGPSWRQTKRILTHIASFTRHLPPGIAFKPQKTLIHFANGSSIEAFPNNPETIRGPTLHVVYADEFNFVANDQELYDAILYTLGTTDGKFVCSSTPWHTDSVFFKIFNHKDFSDFRTSHVPIQKALSPNGPLKPNIIQRIKTQMGDDPSRWRREMEAEWAEDDDVWLTQSLIASCIGTSKNCPEELRMFDSDANHEGEFFAGLDLAQTRDYSVLSVVERQNDSLYLRHLKIFQQPTIYATVLGYTKALQDRWGGLEKLRVDFTREGPSIIADMENAGIDNVEGVNFSVPRKSEMASLLKQRMLNKRFFYPLLNWERPYRGEICTELNIERFELRRDGNIGFSHPMGTHDDIFWSIALAVYATANIEPEPFLAVIPRE
jgi:phage FluMu gp28-like protein